MILGNGLKVNVQGAFYRCASLALIAITPAAIGIDEDAHSMSTQI